MSLDQAHCMSQRLENACWLLEKRLSLAADLLTSGSWPPFIGGPICTLLFKQSLQEPVWRCCSTTRGYTDLAAGAQAQTMKIVQCGTLHGFHCEFNPKCQMKSVKALAAEKYGHWLINAEATCETNSSLIILQWAGALFHQMTWETRLMMRYNGSAIWWSFNSKFSSTVNWLNLRDLAYSKPCRNMNHHRPCSTHNYSYSASTLIHAENKLSCLNYYHRSHFKKTIYIDIPV